MHQWEAKDVAAAISSVAVLATQVGTWANHWMVASAVAIAALVWVYWGYKRFSTVGSAASAEPVAGGPPAVESLRTKRERLAADAISLKAGIMAIGAKASRADTESLASEVSAEYSDWLRHCFEVLSKSITIVDCHNYVNSVRATRCTAAQAATDERSRPKLSPAARQSVHQVIDAARHFEQKLEYTIQKSPRVRANVFK